MRKLIINGIKFLTILGIMVSVIIMVLGYQAYENEMRKMPVEIKVTEIKNKEDFITIEEISPYFLDAIVATEDHRFYKHGAIDGIAILRATVENVLEGRLVQGGSTITQQLAKNMYFTNEKTFIRKIGELFVAYELEEEYSKEEILELYVNIIYYGDGNTGIKEASNNYFHKAANQLTLDEATLLAGLPQAPSRYALSENYEAAKKRQKQVVAAMDRYTENVNQEVAMNK